MSKPGDKAYTNVMLFCLAASIKIWMSSAKYLKKRQIMNKRLLDETPTPFDVFSAHGSNQPMPLFNVNISFA